MRHLFPSSLPYSEHTTELAIFSTIPSRGASRCYLVLGLSCRFSSITRAMLNLFPAFRVVPRSTTIVAYSGWCVIGQGEHFVAHSSRIYMGSRVDSLV